MSFIAVHFSIWPELLFYLVLLYLVLFYLYFLFPTYSVSLIVVLSQEDVNNFKVREASA